MLTDRYFKEISSISELVQGFPDEVAIMGTKLMVKQSLYRVLVIAGISFLAACNGRNTPAPAAAQPESRHSAPASTTAAEAIPDPCTLLTKDEAESILGEPAHDPEPGSLGGNKICDFKSVKLHGGIAPYSIHIALTSEKRETWDAGKKLHFDAKEAHPVPGIGDDAFFLLDDLLVYAKGLDLNVNVLKEIDKPDHMKAVQEAEKQVAQKVVARL